MAGVVVLIGWMFNIAPVKSIVPGFVAMQPWTATGLVLGAAALWLAASELPALRSASAIPAIGLLIAGGVPAVEHLTGGAFGTDTWLFPKALISAQVHDYPHIGRMSWAAASGLTMLATALLLAPRVTRPAGQILFSLLATASLATAVMPLLGYGLRLEPLDAMFLRNPLALHSALGIAMLSIGTLALRPDAGWLRIASEQGPRGWAISGLFGVAALLLALGSDAATRAGTIAASASAASVRLRDLLSTVKDAEGGQQGYLLSGRRDYLEPYEAARTRLPQELAAVEDVLIAVNERPAETGRLRGLIADKMTELAETIALQGDGRSQAAVSIVDTGRGKALMEAIRAEVLSLEQVAASDAAARITRAWRIATMAAVGIMALAVLAFRALTAAGRAQREAAASIARSEARQRDLLTTLGLGTFMAREPDGTILYWAEGCVRLYGWTAEEAVGRCSHDLLNTVFPVPLCEIEAKLLRTGEWTGDLHHRARDGRELVVTAHKVLRCAADGQPATVLEALSDVTAQRRAEAAWLESQALLRAVIETTPGLIYAKDRQSRLMLANSAVEATVGKAWADMAGRTDREFLDDPAEAEATMAHDRQIMESGQTQEVEEQVTDPNGRTRVWLSTKSPLRNTDGEVTGIVGVALDVTERKTAEAALVGSEARLRLVQQISGIAYTDWTYPDAEALISPEYARIYGLPQEQTRVMLSEWIALIHPEDQTRIAAISPESIGAGGTVTSEFRIFRTDGELRWIIARAEAFAGPSGLPERVVAAHQDITEIVVAREALAKRHQELENLSRHLAEARDRAEEANRAKSRFLAGMSHELRSPLNGILGHAHLLQMDGGLNPAQGARVGAMLQAGRHLLEMINCVLDLSEIEAERTTLRPMEIDAQAIAAECLDLIRPMVEEKGLRLSISVAPATPSRLVGDPTRLRQILLNLLGNASKFTSRGSIDLRLRRILADGSGLRIEVVDTGPGISADERQRLFQDFERLDTVATRGVEGAGLGLAISARLASLMGGSLGHADNPAGGSIFWLELPLDTAARAPPTVASGSNQPEAAAAPPPERSFNILIVDDILMNRDIASAFLSRAGHNPTCVEGGAEAVEAAASTDFDVILMDVRMPGMDGLEATRRIRALEGKRGQVPIVALTAQAFTDQVAECRKAGMDSHLAKPFDPAMLATAVISAIAVGRRYPNDVSRSKLNTLPV